MARRFGCFVLLLSLVVVSIGVVGLWIIGTLLGLVAGNGVLTDLAQAAFLVILIAGGIALIFGIRLARAVGPPLDSLVEAARRVEGGDYTVRVPEVNRGPRELRGLVRAFNTMTARLEADEQQRRGLLADVSHELRTPLAVIQGNAEAIVDGVYPADAQHLGTILEEARVLSRLIEDLRTLGLAEAGTLALHREPTDLSIVVGEVGRSFEQLASTAGAHVEIDLPDDLPLLDVDPIRLREVLANLVANALRYVDSGGTVRIAARTDENTVLLEVADNGPGIPADLLPSVFDRFAKSSESRGTGLGLAIAKAIVEAHGGRISAESGTGVGTTMTIELPNPRRSGAD
ncbi:MAG TPA: ATP-binding protein [Candidatus Limnocylindrales bacterium]|nr:ATP-binding protein [Candidatus Limnocylindrales bacterium]